ncbi:hypothetical protein QYH69_21710 [Paraburkholderia sp. SARCC-3016]|uniref:hypothetical protein n=1 Tax=Paraburkholderia sp. SARCC-3016 TaxID=3058611 RepID=UPI002806BD46|nr:hypothetical protein [Paraburkholderia sp. SARCC-3016]MDQ7979860.1 hypothetical protein [Paraburkholderia sp. SARCC-3016]
MRKVNRPSNQVRTPLGDVIVTSEAGAYSSIPDRPTSSSKGRKPGTGRFLIIKGNSPKTRNGVQNLGVVVQKHVKTKGLITHSKRRIGETIQSGKWKTTDPALFGKELVRKGNRIYVYESSKRPDYRSLAQEALKRVKTADDSTALEFLTTIIKGVSSGKSVIISERPRYRSNEATGTVAGDPLASARARGRRYALDQYENPDNLALLEARDYAGRNERSINELRQSGELYALLPPGKTRGFRYPKWQFDAAPNRIKAALRPFVEANANCWVIHSFMTRTRDTLKGKSPAEVILDDSQDIKSVIDLAESDLSGEQGAQ